MIRNVNPLPCRPLSRSIAWPTSLWLSPAITSSSSRISGSSAIARATSSRRRSLRVRSPARRRAWCTNPTFSSTAIALSRATASERWRMKAPIITFSSALSAISGLAIWNVRPMPRRARSCGASRLIWVPCRRTSPAVGASWPVSRLKKVVLPAPLGPMMLTISPWRTDRLTSSTARRPRKCLLTPVTASSRSLAGAAAPCTLRGWAPSGNCTVLMAWALPCDAIGATGLPGRRRCRAS